MRAVSSASASESVTTCTTPTAPAVGVRPAELLHVDVLAGHRPDDVRTGDEHPAGRAHDHQVGQRRAVGGAAGRGAEHHGDLRHPAGGAHHRREHLADRVQRRDALGQPGAAGVPDADRPGTRSRSARVDGVDDVPAARRRPSRRP